MIEIIKLSPFREDHQKIIFGDLFLFKLEVYIHLYPMARTWYTNNFITSFYDGKKSGFIVLNNGRLIGFSFIKYCDQKNGKLCSFFVLPEYRQTGIGSSLMSLSITELLSKNSCDITLTAPQERIFGGTNQKNLSRLLSKFNFSLTDIAHNRYREGKSEYIFIRNRPELWANMQPPLRRLHLNRPCALGQRPSA